MESKKEIEIGYLNIVSWEHLALTGQRYCHDVKQLKWLLPDEPTISFKQLISLQQDIFLSDCVPLDPLVDYSKRRIYIKSKSFYKPLTLWHYELLEKLDPVSKVFSMLSDRSRDDYHQVYFAEHFRYKFNELEGLNWDDYVLKHLGYSTGRFHEGKYNNFSSPFYVPSSDDQIKSYYSVMWEKHHYEDEILKHVFENESSKRT